MPARYRRARLIDWVGKADTTFSDAITAVRRWLWQEWFLQSPVIPQPLQNSVGRFEICCYTVWHRRRRVKIRAKVELRTYCTHIAKATLFIPAFPLRKPVFTLPSSWPGFSDHSER